MNHITPNNDIETCSVDQQQACYPSVEADGDGYTIRLDDDLNWFHLTFEEAKQLCCALLEDGPGAAKHLLKLTIG